jgi:hypothetical protein
VNLCHAYPIGTGNTGVFILKAKTKYEKFYNLLSDVEDESNITPSDEKLSEPINIIKSSSYSLTGTEITS